MTIDEISIYLDKILKKAEESGFSSSEASYSQGSSTGIEVLNGEVSNFECSEDCGVSFRGLYNGKMGTASSSELNDESVDWIISQASMNASVIDSDDIEFIHCENPGEVLEYELKFTHPEKNTYDNIVKIGLSLEKAILNYDPAIKAVDYLSVGFSGGTSFIKNSEGLIMRKSSDLIVVVAEVRGEKNGVVKTNADDWYGVDIDDYNEEELVKKICDDLLSKFDAKSVKSGKYDVVFKNRAVSELITSFFGNFSYDAMQKGLSLLKGREGEKIASENLSLYEDPFYDKALSKLPFDQEGIKTTSKFFIENGVFKTGVHNLKTANKAGTVSTGNGFMAGGGMGLGVTNLILKPGDKSFDELLSEMSDGIVITELSGLHAGLNRLSGDFSLLTEGYLVKDGKIERSIEQITVADNFYEIIKRFKDIGNDIYKELGSNGERFMPSVLVTDVSISGSET